MNQGRTLRSKVEKETILICLFATFAWGIITHAAGFSSVLFSHDSLRELYTHGMIGYYGGSANQWKIALGRFAWPIYQLIFRVNGTTTSPWLAGMLALFWLFMANVELSRIFKIRSGISNILLCGVMVSNIAVFTMAATYIGDLDANMFGILCAVLAFSFWTKNRRGQWLAIPLLTIAMGLYQCNLAIFITLVIIYSIIGLLNHEKHTSVLKNGMRAIGLLAGAGVLYLMVASFISALTHAPLTSQENGVAKIWEKSGGSLGSYLYDLYLTYANWLFSFIGWGSRSLRILNCCYLAAICFSVIYAFKKTRIPAANMILILVLAAVLPLGMNIAGFLNHGDHHDLMSFAFWFLYLCGILLFEFFDRNQFKNICGKGLCLLISLILFLNVKTANGMYLAKNIGQMSTLSTMTRVLNRLELIDGYTPNETKTMFVGLPSIAEAPAFTYQYSYTGGGSTVISGKDVYAAYFEYILLYPIQLVNNDEYLQISEAIDLSTIEAFPAERCYLWYGDVLVFRVQ